MELRININDMKADIFFGFLELFKKDGLVNEYKIIYNDYEKEILNDLKEFGKTLENAKTSKGYKTNKYVEIKI